MVELISAEQREQVRQAIPQFQEAKQKYSEARSTAVAQIEKLKSPRVTRTISDLNALRKIRQSQTKAEQQKQQFSETISDIEKTIPELEKYSQMQTPEEYMATQQEKIKLAQRFIEKGVPYSFIEDTDIRAMVKQGYFEMASQKQLAQKIQAEGIPANVQAKIDTLVAKGINPDLAFTKVTGLRVIGGKTAGDQVEVKDMNIQYLSAPNRYSVVEGKDLKIQGNISNNESLVSSGLSSGLSSGSNIKSYIGNIISNISAGSSAGFQTATKETYSSKLGAFVSASPTGESATAYIRPVLPVYEDLSRIPYEDRKVFIPQILSSVDPKINKLAYPTFTESIGIKAEDLIKKGVTATKTIIDTYDKAMSYVSYRGDTNPMQSMTQITEAPKGMGGKGTLVSISPFEAERRGLLNIEQKRVFDEQRIQLRFNLENERLNERFSKGEIPYNEYQKNLKALEWRTNQDLQKVNKEYIQKALAKQVPYTLATTAVATVASGFIPYLGGTLLGLSTASGIKNRAAIVEQAKLAPKQFTTNILAGIVGGLAGAKGVSYLKTPIYTRIPSAKYTIQEVSTVGKAILQNGEKVKTLNIISTKYVPEQFATEQPRWRNILGLKPKTAVKVSEAYTQEARTTLFDIGEEYKGFSFVGKQGSNLKQVFDVSIPKKAILPLKDTARTKINLQLIKQLVGDMQLIPKEAAEKIFSSKGIAERIGRFNIKKQEFTPMSPQTSYTRAMTINNKLIDGVLIKETPTQSVSIPIEGERYYFTSRTTTYQKPIGSIINPLFQVRNLNIFPKQIGSKNIEFGKGTLITGVAEEAKIIRLPKPEKVLGQTEPLQPSESITSNEIAIQKTAEATSTGLLKTRPTKIVQPTTKPIRFENIATSAFVGAGQYERTSESLSSIQLPVQTSQIKNIDEQILNVAPQLSFVDTSIKKDSLQDNKLDTKLSFFEVAPQLSLNTQSNINKEISKENINFLPALKEIELLKTEQSEEVKQTAKSILRTPSSSTTRQPTKTVIKTPLKKKGIPLSLGMLTALKQAFDVVVFKGGKEVVIGKSLPEGKAKKLGVENILSTLRASFKLRKKGFTSQEDIKFEIPKTLFTTAKRDSSRFVQKKETRLKGRPEIREILGVRKTRGGGKFRWL